MTDSSLACTRAQQRWAWTFIVVTALLRLAVAAACDLKVEEAYYWCYAQHLSPGYFDHPPMVAWLIALFAPLGTHPVWVRLPAVLIFAATGWLFWDTLRRLWNDSVARTGLLLHSLLPAYSWHSIIMLPDSPLMLFWTLGIWATTRLIQEGQPRWWWVIGVATGLGMDSKYPAAMIPLAAFLACISLKKPRSLWLGPSMLGSAGLAMALFSPVLYWNATHEWASFRFQAAERFQEANTIGERLGSLLYPAAMLGPALYLALPWLIAWGWRNRERTGVLLGLCWTLPFGILLLWVTSKRLVALNWPLPGYLGLLLLLAPWVEKGRWRWFLVLPAAAMTFIPQWAMVVPLAAANSGDDINQWAPLSREASRQRSRMPDPERTFYLAYGYQPASQMAFAGLPQDRIVSLNALGMRGLAYDYWTQPAQFNGWDAVVVAYCRVRSDGRWDPQTIMDMDRLRSVFQRLDGPYEMVETRAGRPLRLYQYWRGYGYQFPKDKVKGKHERPRLERRAVEGVSRSRVN